MSAPPSAADEPQGSDGEAGLPRWQRWAVFALAFAVTLAGTTLGPTLVAAVSLPGGIAVTPTVKVDAPNGPAVHVATQTDINGTGLFPGGGTVDLGPVSFSGGDGVSADVDRLNGTWTNVSALQLGASSLTIDPNDKQTVTVSGDADSLAFREFVVDDGTADLAYAGASGSTTLTLRGLPANTWINLVDSTGTILANGSTTATGTLQVTVPNSQHTVHLLQGKTLDQQAPYYPGQTGNVSPIDDWLPNPTATIDAVGDLLVRIGPAFVGTGDRERSGTGLVGTLLTGLVFAGGVAMAVGGIGLGPVGGVVVGLTLAYAMPAMGLAPAWLQPVILFLIAALAGLAALRAVNS